MSLVESWSQGFYICGALSHMCGGMIFFYICIHSGIVVKGPSCNLLLLVCNYCVTTVVVGIGVKSLR